MNLIRRQPPQADQHVADIWRERLPALGGPVAHCTFTQMPKHSLSLFVLQRIAAAMVLVGLAGVVRAQIAPRADAVVSQRYFEASFGANTIQGFAKAELHGGASVQIPLVDHVDGDLAYSRSDWRPTFANGVFANHVQTDAALVGLTTYTGIDKIRVFGGGYVFRQWQHQTLSYAGSPVYDAHTDTNYWNVNAGAEVAVHRIVISPSIGYTRRFQQEPYSFAPRDRGTFFYGLEAHRWFSARVGGFARATYDDPQSKAFLGSWIYTTGIRTRF